MAKLSKRMKAIREKLEAGKLYPIDDALELLGTLPRAKFEESVDVAVNLGVDPRKSDQVVRGSTVLPHGTGKTVRVAVFTQGANADAAKEAGADIVGMDDLADQVKAGNLHFDVVVASPDAMRVVGQLGQILGPRGLMPNPKLGTVTMDVGKAVSAIKAGMIEVRVDKGGVVHAPVGKRSFDEAKLIENVQSLIAELNRMKPAAAKGRYMQQMTISSTMGAGVRVDVASLS